MPTDPFNDLGLTRRPLFEVFGLPQDRGTFSPRMQQAIQEDTIRRTAQEKFDLDLADLERRNQAERAADEFIAQNPGAAIAGSSRAGGIQRYQMMQQRGPSYSDQVLARSLANRLSPWARERFYQGIQEGRGANQAFDDAQADEEDMKLRTELVESGLPMDRLKEFEGRRIDPLTAASLRASLKRGSDPENLADMNQYAKLLEDEIEGLKVAGFEPKPEEPEYEAYTAKVAELRDLNDRRKSVLRQRSGVGQTAVPAPVGTPAPAAPAGTAAPAAAPSAGGFKGVMQSFSKPNVEDILRVDPKEVIAGINDPGADENTFIAAINDPANPADVKKVALDRLEKFAKAVKPSPSIGVGEHFARVENIRKLVEEGRKAVEMAPVLEKYMRAWDAEKEDMAGRIARFAKLLGVAPEQVEKSLRDNEEAPIRHLVPSPAGSYKRPEMQNPNIPIREAFELFIADSLGGKPGEEVLLNKRPDRFFPFEGSKFNQELGMAGPIPGFPRLGRGKNYAEVLDVYLGEKAKPAAATPEASQAKASSAKIQIGQPRKVQ